MEEAYLGRVELQHRRMITQPRRLGFRRRLGDLALDLVLGRLSVLEAASEVLAH